MLESFKPGVDAQSTPALNAASWNESENIRFFQGLAQKSGGFSGYTEQVADAGRPSALRAWTALSGIANLAIGSRDLVSLFASDTVSNVTPRTKVVTLPVDLSTTEGDTTVTVADPLSQAQEGDWFQIRAPIAVGGIILAGAYRVDTVVDPTHYTIEAAVEATATVANGGAARQFAATSGSDTVTITLADHGLFTGQGIYIRDAVAVGGLSLVGNYLVTVQDPDTYTITAAEDATSTQTVSEYGGNMRFSFLTGLILAASATVEPFDADEPHAFYVPLDVLTVVGGTGTAPEFHVITTEVVQVDIAAGGSGGPAGDTHTFRIDGGVGTSAEFTATIASDGSLTGATPTITNAGSYTTNPAVSGQSITDITDGSLTGATVDVGMWPETVSLTDPGHMTSIPDNPADTTDTGSGQGAQLNVTWDYSQGAQEPMGYEYVILDNWGEFLVAIPAQGPVYVWQPKRGVATPLEDVGSAPQANLGGFVATQQQILVVLGTINFGTDEFDPMLVRWSNVGDYTDFTPSSSNQAGSFRLPLGSTIVAGIPVPGRNLVWTDLGLYSMVYSGLPFVYTFQPIGTNCGLLGPHAFGVMGDGTTLWMSQNQFYAVTSGGAPQPIPCSVWDLVFPNLDKANAHQITCATNSYFGEISWYVPQADGSVICARLQVQSGNWDYTSLAAGSIFDRAAWLDQNVFGPPFGADPDGNVYQQETTRDAAGEVLPARLLSGMALFNDGDQVFQFTHIAPDVKFDPVETHGPGTLNMKVLVFKDPQAPPRVKGPYPINARTRRIPCRGRGKGLQFEFSSDDTGSWWRLGRVLVEAFPDGSGG